MAKTTDPDAPKAPTDSVQYLCRHMPEWIRVTFERYAQVHGLSSVEYAIYHMASRNAEFRLLWKNLRDERIRAGIMSKAEGLTDFTPPVPALTKGG